MATITASMVKELREKTGAGMMECKKALESSDGNMEAAVDELRKRGQAIADKKGARATKSGLIIAKVEGTSGVLVEINCETDFVARNEDFKALGADVAEIVHAGKLADAAELVEAACAKRDGKKVGQILQESIAKIGENLAISRFVKIDASQGEGFGFVQAYIHPPGMLGVLVELRTGKAETQQSETFQQLARDLTMHVAAAAPVSISRDEVPAELVERERAIYADQAKMEGKPEKIWDKIIEGKLVKFFQQSCLLEQPFVKDQDVTVQQLVESTAKHLGDTIKLNRIERFVVGGGAEKEA